MTSPNSLESLRLLISQMNTLWFLSFTWVGSFEFSSFLFWTLTTSAVLYPTISDWVQVLRAHTSTLPSLPCFLFLFSYSFASHKGRDGWTYLRKGTWMAARLFSSFFLLTTDCKFTGLWNPSGMKYMAEEELAEEENRVFWGEVFTHAFSAPLKFVLSVLGVFDLGVKWLLLV